MTDVDLTAALSGQDWHAHAACHGYDPRLWDEPDSDEEHAAAGPRAARARLICARCPVRVACRQEGERLGAVGMIWGGQWRGSEPRLNDPSWRPCAVCDAPLKPRQVRCCSRQCQAVWAGRKRGDTEMVAAALETAAARRPGDEASAVLAERFGASVREWHGEKEIGA